MQNEQKKIFIADDERDIVDIMQLILETQGYLVETTHNAYDIFNIKDKDQLPDLILLDIWMQGIDGREICNQLKKNPFTKHIPVLFISANADLEKITAQSNANGFIEKPFDMYDFLRKVEKALIK